MADDEATETAVQRSLTMSSPSTQDMLKQVQAAIAAEEAAKAAGTASNAAAGPLELVEKESAKDAAHRKDVVSGRRLRRLQLGLRRVLDDGRPRSPPAPVCLCVLARPTSTHTTQQPSCPARRSTPS